MLITNVTKKDVAALTKIYNYYILETCVTMEEKPLTVREFYKRVKSISKNYPYFVAKEKGKILGYAYLNVFNERSAYKNTADLTVYLDKSETGRGVGGALYTAIERAAKEKGIKHVVSLITGNNSRSVAFHKAMGFEECGTLNGVADKFGLNLGVVFMIKEI